MKNNLIKPAFNSALKALSVITVKDIQQLSVLDSASVLTALPSQQLCLAKIRSQLASKLAATVSTSWVEQGDMLEVYAVLAALWKYDPTSIKGEWLAAAIQRLVASEAAAGGPYYTDTIIPVAANAQIANFVITVAQPLPNLQHYLAESIASRRFHDAKLTKLGVFCLLARACDQETLTAYIAANAHRAHWQTPLCLAIASTIRTPNLQTSPAILALCQQQQPSGLWAGMPLTQKSRKSHLSSLVTTALIVEILHNHLATSPATALAQLRQKRQDIAQEATKMFAAQPEPLRSSALAVISRVCRADANFEITLLPRFFARALQSQEQFADSYYITLSLANLYVWVAYTIYDDFIDNEGKPAELPVANIAMRASLDCFRSVLPQNARFLKYVADVFTGMDKANAWEVASCRFEVQGNQVVITNLPKYGTGIILAERAFAHALTPMAILALSPYDQHKYAKRIEIAMQHYLIARQLNDDLHDWVKDIQAGQASYVVTAILRNMHVKQGTHNLDTLVPQMRSCFRRETMPKVSRRMLHHISLSRQYFTSSKLLHETNDMYALLDNLEDSARHSLDIHAKGQALAKIS